ncbi:cobalt-factor II C(20)-methyltransferase [Clostridium algidicarnis]|uniref:cobalt-factor II C(20)-methyltransferase n=1 Tax=Clostridium algidicarnis TaxID=37659 RepID=UPI001C0AA6F9|nr:cobalt-factor II C(20)-methyltransferase [Clostridium algidicarnis]MBU3195297.1 cobalt-factor II C(20)-methyltransferase [Clostridium algidicarnis]MBU3208256.1 cobalt-factor II C(20)-methyltransferase [Clostridium algidicarnis]
MAKLYGVGVGPGDKELLTIKAMNIIKDAKVIVVPSAMSGGKSIAHEVAEDYISEDAEVLVKHFPMGSKDQEEKIYEAFKSIEEKLIEGKDVVFLTIGDPFVYSTYIYLLKYVEEKGYETETVPGITSFCACASIAKQPLVIGDEPLLILPANRLDAIKDEKYIVIMKVYKIEEEVINFLEEKGYDYVYIKRAGREGQTVLKDKAEILKQKEYMSLIIANKI